MNTTSITPPPPPPVQYSPGTDPAKNLRSDLWPTMSVADLANQLDIVIQKLSTLSNMMGPSAPPMLIGLYKAHQTAMDDLNALIELRGTKQRRTNGER